MANNFLNAAELDFSAIKSSLKTYLSGQARFSDYDFDGSNMSVLLDVLSYNTYLSNFYLNMVGSEMFLDTATLRESVVSHAKELNYVPQSKTSAKALVNIKIVPTDSPNYIVIPKFYKVTTTIDNATLNFSTNAETIVFPSVNGYVAANVEVYEGQVATEYFTASASTKYRLQSENLDTNSIEVTVINSTVDTSNTVWTRAYNLYGLDAYSYVYFVQGYSANQYELVFGNGITGRALTDGNVVKIRYRDTIGSLGNGAYKFSKGSTIQGYSNVTVTTVVTAAEGSESETIDSIKFNSTRFFTTQERAVTSSDYANLAKARFPQLQSVIAFGGEDLNPPQYGRVGVSVKPYGTAGIISNSLKNEIISYLNQKNLTTQTVIVDPEYFYIKIDTNVTYDSNASTNSSAQVSSLVLNSILSYAQTYLYAFGDDLRYSNLVGSIDAAEASIISNDTTVKIIKRWSPTVGTSSTLSFSFDNALYSESRLYLLPQGHEQALQSTFFTYTHTDGIDYSCFLGDDGLGNVYVYTNQNTSSGVVRTPLAKVGTVDYTNGTVLVNVNVKSYQGSYVSVYGKLKNKDVYAVKNKFLLIESSDVGVTLNPVYA